MRTRSLTVVALLAVALSGCRPGATPVPATNLSVNDQPDAGSVVVRNSDFLVAQPTSGAVVRSPLQVSAQVVSQVTALHARLGDDAGRLLVEADLKLDGTAAAATLTYLRPLTKDGWLEVSATGSTSPPIRLPVQFAEYDDREVLLYFNNLKFDPNLLDCTKVHPVKRTLETHAGPGQIIDALLAGLTAEETAAGYVSQIPNGVTLIGLAVRGTTVEADFTEKLNYQVGGSCRVSAIRAQIEQTLLQFGGIDKVVISADGESEYILQP